MISIDDFGQFPDFPIKGINFYDISPILMDPDLFKRACLALCPSADAGVEVIVGVDARGFIFAPIVAQQLHVGMTMVRKAGKMPGDLLRAQATIEYGDAALVLSPVGLAGKHVHVIDDVLATGGTAIAVAEMLQRAGAAQVSFSFLLEIADLDGREVLSGYDVTSVVAV